MTEERHHLADEQWELIKDIFPPYKTGRPPKINNRQAFNAVLWLCRTGAPWRDLPKEKYDPWETVYTRFTNWRDSELLEKMFQRLNAESDFENLSLDSTSIKAHQHSAGAKKMHSDMK